MTTTKQKNAARRKAIEFTQSKPRKDLTGCQFGRLTVRSYHGSKSHTTYWDCMCQCGSEVLVKYGHLTSGQIQSCGCARRSGKSHPKWSGYEEMTGTFLANIRNNANTRSLDYQLDNEQIWKLFLAQNRKCALSGLPIEFVDSSASLDRIDSSKGYEIENVQWVHKDVNRMKQAFPQQRFIEVCSLIYKHSEKQTVDA